jgi:hypothetical protein
MASCVVWKYHPMWLVHGVCSRSIIRPVLPVKFFKKSNISFALERLEADCVGLLVVPVAHIRYLKPSVKKTVDDWLASLQAEVSSIFIDGCP